MAVDGPGRSSELCDSLRHYLASHPDAADNLAGIRQWWLPETLRQVALEELRGALEQLEASGEIRRSMLPGASELYARASGNIATLSYPGVYIEEVPGGARAIAGVPTSITAFIGRAWRGPVNDPVRVRSYTEFERSFGGLWRESTLGYAVQQFFENGGTEALIVRVHNGAAAATRGLSAGFDLAAASPGKWGEKLRVRVDHSTRAALASDPPESLFNLSVRDTATGVTERHLDLSTDPGNERFVARVLKRESVLVQVVTGTVPATRPLAHGIASPGADPLLDSASSTAFNADGDDGVAITDDQISLAALEAAKEGLWALEKAELFNLLCIPPLTRVGDIGPRTRSAAAQYCRQRRAVYVVDPLGAWSRPHDLRGLAGLESAGWGLERSENAALYFPRLRLADALDEDRVADFAPCGAVAGVIARNDGQRGVWKAPAGNEARLQGVASLTAQLNDVDNGVLNPLAVNCLRDFPATGPVVWGARTLRGADSLASEWKYLPVRRLALHIEESLFRGTQWAAFEPNGEPLWRQLRLHVGNFLQHLFCRGAFQGSSPRKAYFVKCDAQTTTQSDLDQGMVKILLGFAPLKPGEFILLEIRQRTADSSSV